MTRERKLEILIKKLHSAADLATELELLTSNGGYADCLISSIADDLQNQCSVCGYERRKP